MLTASATATTQVTRKPPPKGVTTQHPEDYKKWKQMCEQAGVDDKTHLTDDMFAKVTGITK